MVTIMGAIRTPLPLPDDTLPPRALAVTLPWTHVVLANGVAAAVIPAGKHRQGTNGREGS